MKRIISITIMAVAFIGINAQSIINIPDDHPTIQEGINAAEDGDTILVQPGTYVENINFNGKNIILGSMMLATGDESYIEQTIIDGNQNGSVIMIVNGEDSTAVLNGFTIQNGSGWDSGGQTHGGGIFLDNNSCPVLRNLIVANNIALRCNGAGICCWGGNDCLIENVKVINNDGRDAITTRTNDGSGGIYLDNSSPVLKNVSIANNQGLIAGGLFCSGYSNPVLINVTIANNMAYPSDNNGQTGEFFLWNHSYAILINCIIWGDSLASVVITSDTITILHSDIKGGIVYNGQGHVHWLGGNMNFDPLFEDPANQDYRLSSESPCIDAGIQDEIFIYNNGKDTLIIPPMEYNGWAPDMGAFEWSSTQNIGSKFLDEIGISIYPNPCSGTTYLRYTTLRLRSGQASELRTSNFELYSIQGIKVKTLLNEVQQPGEHELEFDVSDLPAGMYFVRMQIGKQVETVKIVKVGSRQ